MLDPSRTAIQRTDRVEPTTSAWRGMKASAIASVTAAADMSWKRRSGISSNRATPLPPETLALLA